MPRPGIPNLDSYDIVMRKVRGMTEALGVDYKDLLQQVLGAVYKSYVTGSRCTGNVKGSDGSTKLWVEVKVTIVR